MLLAFSLRGPNQNLFWTDLSQPKNPEMYKPRPENRTGSGGGARQSLEVRSGSRSGSGFSADQLW